MSGNSLTLVLLKTQIKNIWHMSKVNIKSQIITSFGGIYYASKAFYALSLDKVINVCLPLYRRMRQMDKDCKKMVAEFVYRHAVWQTFFWIDTFFFEAFEPKSPMVKGALCPNLWRKRSIPTQSRRFNPSTFEVKNGLENGALPFIFAKKRSSIF